MSQHTKNMQEQARLRREQRERERLAAEGAAPSSEASDAAPSGSELEPSASVPPPAVPLDKPSRPQPLTPDLIPDPELVNATGPLTAAELNDLSLCERAFHHADVAQWMKGKAAHATRDRRLYREDGRTWASYCEDELGESESDVNRQIQEWPLAAAISESWSKPRPVPAAHVRALLPLAAEHGEERTAQAYVALRAWAAEAGHRVTAAALTAMVERYSRTADPLPLAQFQAAVRELEGARVPSQSAGRPSVAATPGAGAGSHPNLGDSTQQSTNMEERPGAGAHAGAEQPPTNPEGSHPNLGDSGAETSAAADAIEGEILDERGAVALRALLEAACSTLADDLRGASPNTLKAIAASARHIADTAENAL